MESEVLGRTKPASMKSKEKKKMYGICRDRIERERGIEIIHKPFSTHRCATVLET